MSASESTVVSEVSDEVRAALRDSPGALIAAVDPCWSGTGPAPGWAVIGHWRAGPSGEDVEFLPNEEYRPSPAVLDWPEPTDAVDMAAQRAAAGYAEDAEVAVALASVAVAVLVQADGVPVRASAPDGTPVVPVFTAADHLEPVSRLGYQVMPVTQLLDEVPAGYHLLVNATGPVATLVPVDEIRRAIDGVER